MAARRQECGICMDSLKNPKLIPCHHSFCYKCLEDYVRVNLRNGRFDCPICRTSVKLPKGGMSIFERNFNIDTDSGEKFVCDLCGPKSVACSRCVDCEETLCQSCCYVHEKLKVSRHHKVIDLGNLNSEMKGKIRQRIFCDQHPEEEIKLFCTDCKVLICFLCKAVNHETHATKTVADAAAEVKKTLQTKMNSCLDKLRRVNASKEKGKELDRNIDDAEREELKSVEDHRSHLNHVIDQEVAKVKVKIKNVYDNLRQQNAVFKRDVQNEFKRCSNANDNAQTLTDQGTDIEILKKGPHIEQLISEAISKTDQTPNTRLKNKLFSPAKIKQSVVISLIGIMQDSTDSECYTNQSSMRSSSFQMTQPQLDQGLGTTPSQQIMFMPPYQYISTGAQVIQPMDKTREGTSEHVGLQQKPKAVDSSIKTELSSASLSPARFKAVPLKTRMREGAHEPQPVYSASTPTTINSSAKELKKDPGSKTKAQDMNRKRQIIQASEMEAFMDLPTEAEAPTPPVVEKENQDPTEGTKTLDKVGVMERTPTPPIVNEEVDINIEDVDCSDASVAVENEKSEKQKLKYKYKEDQWSPINHEGKKQYDRDFLLQLQNAPESTLKPLDLPDIPDIIIEKPRIQPMTRDFVDVSNYVDFTPRYVWSGGPSRSGGVPRRASGQRGRGGPGGSASQTKHINLSIQKDIELHHAKEAWKPTHRTDKMDQSEVDIKSEELYKKVRSVLNKFTPQKFQTLVAKMQALEIDTEARLKHVIDLVFEKAIGEPGFSVAYANMCRCLSMFKVPAESKQGDVNFRALLLTRCQREFEKANSSEKEFDSKRKEIEKAATEEEKQQMNEELGQEETKAKRRSLGNIRFIGELFKLKMLTENIMHDCVFKLLRTKDEENLECLCRLLKTIGKELETDKAKPRMDQYFAQMQKIVNEKKLSSRVRFMLQDAIELRRVKWVPRRDDNNPNTIDQFHREVAQEAQDRAIFVQNLPQAKPQKGSRGRPQGQPSGSMGGGADGWNTVSRAPLRTDRTIDPTKLKLSKLGDSENIQLGPGGGAARLGWFKGSTGGGARFQEGEKPNTPGNRFSALSKADKSEEDGSRRGGGRGGLGRPGSSVNRTSQESEREKAIAAAKTIVAQRPSEERSGGREPERAKAMEKPSTPVLELTDDQMGSKTRAIMDEYLHIQDVGEAISCVQELSSSSSLHLFVYNSLNQVLERSEVARRMTGLLLHDLVKKNVILVDTYVKGLNEILMYAEDMEIDIPKIWEYFGQLIGPMVQDGSVPLGFLKQVCEPLRANSKSGILVAEILHDASHREGHKKVARLWAESGLHWSDFVPKNQIDQFLSDKKLEFTQVGNSAPTSPTTSMAIPMIEESLNDLITNRNCSNEEVFDWIEGQVDELTVKQEHFIRALMTAVCRSAVTVSSNNLMKVDKSHIQKRNNLLQKYLDHQANFELQALFALQALVHKLEHPPGVLRELFDILYDEDIISEDAFIQWEKSEDLQEQEGKDSAKLTLGFLISIHRGWHLCSLGPHSSIKWISWNCRQMGLQVEAFKQRILMEIHSVDQLVLEKVKWVPRRDDNNPNTIDQFHREVAQEAQDRAIFVQNLPQAKPQKGSRGRPQGQPSGSMGGGADGWNTVSRAPLRTDRTIDPTKLKLSKLGDSENIQLGPGGGAARLGWFKGSTGGGARFQEGEKPNTPGNRFSALSKADKSEEDGSRRGGGRGGLGRPGSSVNRTSQESEREKAIAAAKTIVAQRPSEERSGGREPERAKAMEKPSTPVLELTDDQMGSKTRAIMDEYLHIQDVGEAISCVQELSSSSSLHLFVYNSLNQVLERSEVARRMTGLLLHDLVKKNVILVDTYVKGLNEILMYAEDMEIDIPKIWEYFGQLIGPMVQDGSVPLGFLKQVCEPLRANSKSGILVAEILHDASHREGHKKVARLWAESGLHWSDFVPKNQIDQFLSDKKLEFTQVGNSAPTSPTTSMAIPMIEESLNDLITNRNCSNEEVFDWIEGQVDELTVKQEHFIRALMTAVCRSAVTVSSNNLMKVDKSHIQKRNNLLQKYLDHQANFELQALFALQALVHKLEHPPGVLRELFDILYDEDIISEDAFIQWEKSEDLQEQEGKGVAMKQVVQFFTWLKEAEDDAES